MLKPPPFFLRYKRNENDRSLSKKFSSTNLYYFIFLDLRGFDTYFILNTGSNLKYTCSLEEINTIIVGIIIVGGLNVIFIICSVIDTYLIE